MRRNIRILGCICLGLIGIFLLYKLLAPKKLTWKDFPRFNGYTPQKVLLINGDKYELPVFKNSDFKDSDARLTTRNPKTVNETITVQADTARTDWEIVLSDGSLILNWDFPNKQEGVKSSKARKEYLAPMDSKIKGAEPRVLIYNISLVEAKDTVLHFYYYNCSEQEKPITERHANYHLQIELKFKDTKATV